MKTEKQKNLDVIEELRQQISMLRTKANGPNDELEELREENQVILPMETSTAR